MVVTSPLPLRRCSQFQEAWSALGLPAMDALPPTAPDHSTLEGGPVDEWPHLLGPLLYLLGATLAFWGSALLRLSLALLSLAAAPLTRWGGSHWEASLLIFLYVFCMGL